MSNDYARPAGGRPIVVKYGGNAMGGDGAFDPVILSLAKLWEAGTSLVLVHGGGPEIDRALEQRGITTDRIDGLRVTDEATLSVTEAVLCGTLNKRLVRDCASLGVRAVGISGEDGGMLVAARNANPALGYVGDVATCDPALLHLLLAAGYLPVVAPLAVNDDSTLALNVNADLAAAAIAGVLRAQAFVMVTNVPRVLRDVNDPESAIDVMSTDEAAAFAASPACTGGMKPKIDAAIAAVSDGARASYICGVQPLSVTLAGNATVVTNS